jgi:hypothetical protein
MCQNAGVSIGRTDHVPARRPSIGGYVEPLREPPPAWRRRSALRYERRVNAPGVEDIEGSDWILSADHGDRRRAAASVNVSIRPYVIT